MITIGVVDDHDLIRHGLEHVLAQSEDFAVVLSGRDLASVATQPDMDVLVLDLYLAGDEPCVPAVVLSGRDLASVATQPDMDVLVLDLYLAGDEPCVPAIAELSQLYNILVISASARPADLVAAVRAGARGYVTKSEPADLLTSAIRVVAARGFYLSAELADILHARLSAPAKPASAVPLAPREEEVLVHIAQGFTYDQIARRMGIKKSTVDTHIERIRRKLQVGNKAQLIAAALDRIAERGLGGR